METIFPAVPEIIPGKKVSISDILNTEFGFWQFC